MSDDTQSQPSAPSRDEHADAHHPVVEQARADLAAGREWQAREALLAHVAEHHDPEALELLGEVQHAMRDLPAAGAAWFGTGRRGADVDEAVQAWRERHGDRFPEMWRSLPWPVREHEGNKRVDALRRRAEADAPTVPSTAGLGGGAPTTDGNEGFDAAVVIALVLAVLFVVCAVIGFITVLLWLVPN